MDRATRAGPPTGPEDGGMADFLFSVRNNGVPNGDVNEVLIPALCRRAEVSERDSRWRITSLRAWATIAWQIYNALGLCKNPNWSRCTYRMACVRCEFYVPGEGSQYLRA